MVFLCSALYSEGEPFIKSFSLKKDTSITKFQVFKNNDIALIITGCGKIRASIAVAFLLTKLKASYSDILINIGLCGAKDPHVPVGSCFLCNKIKDYDNNFSYYPDILFRHPFSENSIETFSHVLKNINELNDCELCDMESSAVYEAASVFLQPHEIFFIKIVSDHLNIEKSANSDFKSLISKNSAKIIKWTSYLIKNYIYDYNVFTAKDISLFEDVCNNLKFSISMKNELKALLKYKKLEHHDIDTTLLSYKNIECCSKKEGKLYLGEIKSKLI